MRYDSTMLEMPTALPRTLLPAQGGKVQALDSANEAKL